MKKLSLKLVSIFCGLFILSGCAQKKITCYQHKVDRPIIETFRLTVNRLVKAGAKLVAYEDRVEIVLPASTLFIRETANLSTRSDFIIFDLVEMSKYYSHTFTMLQGIREEDPFRQSLTEARLRELGGKLRKKGLAANVITMGTINNRIYDSKESNKIKVIFKKREKNLKCPGNENFCFSGDEVLICN